MASVNNPVSISRANDNLRRIGAELRPFYWIDPNFENRGLNNYQTVTSTTTVAVYTAKSGTIGQVFADPDNCTVSQQDIVEFKVKHPEWLGRDGVLTLFLVKEADQFFVVTLGVWPFGTRVHLARLNVNQVIEKEIRVVLPLLKNILSVVFGMKSKKNGIFR